MKSNIENLIFKANNIIEKRDKESKEKLLTFNIFDICNIARDEVRVCRFISELLNPKGRHSQGIKYLKQFFKTVLKYEVLPNDSELNNAIVLREELIKGDRRIDISISLNINGYRQYIPIEVKIYAEDQENQCNDYYQHSLKMNNNDIRKSFIYYLTPEGRFPSEYSVGKLSDNEIKTLSFRTDVLNWINECIEISSDNSESLISEKQVLLQFKKIVSEIGDNMEYNNIEIQNLISNDAENFKAAVLISKTIKSNANIKLKEFYDSIFSKLVGWKKEDTFENDVNDFLILNGKKPTLYKDIMINNIKCELAITTEANGIPFIGASLKKGENIQYEEDLQKFFNNCMLSNNYEHGWITWQYLPNDDETINFKDYNDLFYMLFDNDLKENLINKCIELVNDFEKKINECLIQK